MRKEIFILNLCHEIPFTYQQYFASKNIKLVDPRLDEKKYNWTHILTQNVNDFSFIREAYQTIENDIQIISVTSIIDKQNFVLSNGKLCLDDFWKESELKEFLLDKFFQDYLGEDIKAQDALFDEVGQFTINQFFSFGDKIDHLTKSAFAVQAPGLSIKSYIDHLMMYLAALHGSKKMELPVEISYANSDKFFGVQFFFSAQNLMIDDLGACLSLHHLRNTEEALLATAINLCDFFDFSLIARAQKVAVTALWIKQEQLAQPSFMLSYLPKKARIVSYIKEDLPLHQTDFTQSNYKIQLPSLRLAEEGLREVSKDHFSEVVATRISAVVELDQVQRILSSEADDEMQRLASIAQPQDSRIIVGDEVEFENLLTKVSSCFDELAVYKKDFFNQDEFLNEFLDLLRISYPEVMEDQSLSSSLAENIKNSFEQFCQSKMLVSDQLKGDDIENFKVNHLKDSLRERTVFLDSPGSKLIEQLKAKLQRNLRNEFQEEDLVRVISGAQENKVDSLRVQAIFKDSLKDALETSFDFSSKGTISDEEEQEIVQNLSSALDQDDQVIEEMIRNDEGIRPYHPLFPDEVSSKETALMVQVDSLSKEKQALADKLQATLMEIKVLKDSKILTAGIHSKANQENLNNIPHDLFDENVFHKKEIHEKLAKGEFSAKDQTKLSELLGSEQVLMTAVREEVLNSKKQIIEASQKEALFASELEKLNRQLRARDLILQKSKETMSKLSERKEADIEFLQNKLNQAQQLLTQNGSQNFVQKNKVLESQNANLAKQLDIFKAKLKSLSSNLKEFDHTDSLKEEARKLQMENNLLQNSLIKLNKEFQRSSSKIKLLEETSQKFKHKAGVLEQKLLEQEKLDKLAPPAKSVKAEASLTESVNGEVQLNKIKELEGQINELELRLSEASQSQRSGSADEKKLGLLEANLKKLTQDLIESRSQSNEFKKEINKLRQERTAMQNKMDRMNKELTKVKKTA